MNTSNVKLNERNTFPIPKNRISFKTVIDSFLLSSRNGFE